MKSRYIFPLALLAITIIAQSVPAQAGDSGTTLSGFECLQLVCNRYGIKALSGQAVHAQKHPNRINPSRLGEKVN
jgi:hypothetical protein